MFAELKALLSTQPVLAAPISKEPLLLNIAATGQVVSTVLTVEREEEGKAYKVQRTVYYISEVLTPSKQRYPHYHKLVYGIYLTTEKVDHKEGCTLLLGSSNYSRQRRSIVRNIE